MSPGPDLFHAGHVRRRGTACAGVCCPCQLELASGRLQVALLTDACCCRWMQCCHVVGFCDQRCRSCKLGCSACRRTWTGCRCGVRVCVTWRRMCVDCVCEHCVCLRSFANPTSSMMLSTLTVFSCVPCAGRAGFCAIRASSDHQPCRAGAVFDTRCSGGGGGVGDMTRRLVPAPSQ